ncbi:MAG: hypothetical protein EZS28_020586, partial [Streblomastix strix]
MKTTFYLFLLSLLVVGILGQNINQRNIISDWGTCTPFSTGEVGTIDIYVDGEA